MTSEDPRKEDLAPLDALDALRVDIEQMMKARYKPPEPGSPEEKLAHHDWVAHSSWNSSCFDLSETEKKAGVPSSTCYPCAREPEGGWPHAVVAAREKHQRTLAVHKRCRAELVEVRHLRWARLAENINALVERAFAQSAMLGLPGPKIPHTRMHHEAIYLKGPGTSFSGSRLLNLKLVGLVFYLVPFDQATHTSYIMFKSSI